MNQIQDETEVETELLRAELGTALLAALEPLFRANRERAKLAGGKKGE